MAGGVTGASEVMFAPKSLPWHDIYALLKERSSQVKELGSVGDAPGPLLFGAYHVPYKDLTSYASSTDELQGLLRGDGDLTVKPWAGSYAAYVTGGKGQVLLAYTMRPTWKLQPSVPTVSQLLKKDPPSSTGEGLALATDTTALDGGTGLFAPPGTPPAVASALQKAVKYAITQPGFAAKAVSESLSSTYESPADQAAALRAGTVPATVATMRKYVPLHTGVAS
jgi:tripartite-type tricarboxylate transporter receptor subunit TctC